MASDRVDNLLEAVERNDLDAVKYLIEKKGVSLRIVNDKQQTPAHIAVEKSYLNVFRYLLDQDESFLVAEDIMGDNVLHYAVEQGNLFLVKYLVEKRGADIFKPIELRLGNTAVHLAAQAGHLPILKFFIEDRFANFNLRNTLGETLLFIAAEKQHMHIVKYLVERWNADATTLDAGLRNILFVSARVGDLRVPKYLLDERNITSFDVNYRDPKGCTIVYYASMYGYCDFVKYFVGEKGADVNIPDNNRKTPVYQASNSGNVKILMYLVECAGADLHIQDNRGQTPMDVAADKKVSWYLTRATHQRRVRSVSEPSIYIPFKVFDNHIPLRGRLEGSGQRDVFATSKVDILGNSFLSLVEFYVRCLIGRSQRPKRMEFRSPQEILQSKIDPVALTTINADSSELSFEK